MPYYGDDGSHLTDDFFGVHFFIESRSTGPGRCANCSYSEPAAWHERRQKSLFDECEKQRILDELLAELESPTHPLRYLNERSKVVRELPASKELLDLFPESGFR